VLRYTFWRLLIFVVFLLVLLFLGVPELWAVVFAALFSMVTSFFLLARQREQMARQLEERVERSRARRAQKLARERTDEDEEDAEVEGGR
jgi:ABC-type bacteriocin/lantibiotic exporter with double-glycine peptidase domain